MTQANQVHNNASSYIVVIFFYFYVNVSRKVTCDMYYITSNHRLESAGLNAFEELLFRCWQ